MVDRTRLANTAKNMQHTVQAVTCFMGKDTMQRFKAGISVRHYLDPV